MVKQETRIKEAKRRCTRVFFSEKYDRQGILIDTGFAFVNIKPEYRLPDEIFEGRIEPSTHSVDYIYAHEVLAPEENFQEPEQYDSIKALENKIREDDYFVKGGLLYESKNKEWYCQKKVLISSLKILGGEDIEIQAGIGSRSPGLVKTTAGEIVILPVLARRAKTEGK